MRCGIPCHVLEMSQASTQWPVESGLLFILGTIDMKIILSLLAAVSLLYGCAVYTPGGSVVVDPGHEHRDGGGFCPPGQAKKGNC